jgi:hypothetical protein
LTIKISSPATPVVWTSQEVFSGGKTMNRYLVESNHSEEECHHVVEQFVYYGYIMHFDWGCQAGVHSSWAIVEAGDEREALLSVPAFMRSKARAVKLNKFTPEMIQVSHGQHALPGMH